MFGRKDKKAIATLSPHHQALVNDQQLVVSLRPNEWDDLLHSLRRHDELVKKHHLPARTLDFVLPLLRILLQDVPPDGYIGLRTDLRGYETANKRGQSIAIPPNRPNVKSIQQTNYFDPWLALEAKLNNRAKLDLWVGDSVRARKITKRGSSGKIKTKQKMKSTQRLRARLALPGAMPVAMPANGIPSWCHITMERSGQRIVLEGRSKYPVVLPEAHGLFHVSTPQAPGAPIQGQLNNVLLLLGEMFRWVPNARPAQEAS